MTTPELLPCPFCGGEADIWRANGDRTAWIACMSRCAVLVSKEYTTDAEAIAAWNTRAPLSPAVLAELPEVRALIRAETERCAKIVDEAIQISRVDRLPIAALPAQGVRVKPLEWEEYSGESFNAQASLGEYVVEKHPEGWGMWSPDETDGEDAKSWHLSDSAAKAAAQRDYESRILSAIIVGAKNEED